MLLIVLLLVAINCSDATLFKHIKFPIKNTTRTTFLEKSNVASRIECASMCAIMPNQCNAFNFHEWNNTCQMTFVEFPLSPSNASSLTAYVNYGKLRTLKIQRRIPYNRLTIQIDKYETVFKMHH